MTDEPWSNPEHDILKDIRDTLAAELKKPYRPIVWLHNPKCKAVETQNSNDCNCIPLRA